MSRLLRNIFPRRSGTVTDVIVSSRRFFWDSTVPQISADADSRLCYRLVEFATGDRSLFSNHAYLLEYHVGQRRITKASSERKSAAGKQWKRRACAVPTRSIYRR